jgi:tetratricopeptide (TPR) repeat protein
MAHHAVALFEMSRGDLEHALSDERTALNYEPEAPGLLLNVAYVYLRRSEYKQALEYLDKAKRFASDNADVAKLAGWSYYGLNKMDQAVAEWKRSLALRPDREVQAALERRRRQAGRGKLQGKKAHTRCYSGERA